MINTLYFQYINNKYLQNFELFTTPFGESVSSCVKLSCKQVNIYSKTFKIHLIVTEHTDFGDFCLWPFMIDDSAVPFDTAEEFLKTDV